MSKIHATFKAIFFDFDQCYGCHLAFKKLPHTAKVENMSNSQTQCLTAEGLYFFENQFTFLKIVRKLNLKSRSECCLKYVLVYRQSARGRFVLYISQGNIKFSVTGTNFTSGPVN